MKKTKKNTGRYSRDNFPVIEYAEYQEWKCFYPYPVSRHDKHVRKVGSIHPTFTK
jgi:hypothetical protein